MLGAPLWATEGEHDLIYSGGAAVTSALAPPRPARPIRGAVRAGAARAARARGGRRQRPPSPAGCSPSPGRSCASSSSTGRCSPETPSCRSFAGPESRPSSPVTCTATSAGRSGACPSSRSGRAARGRARPSSPRPRRAPPISLLDYGSLLVEVSSSGIGYTFVDERGRVLDRWAEP